MSLRLRPAIPDDVPDFVDIVTAAFATNKVHVRCFPPGNASTRKFWGDVISDEIHHANAHWIAIEAVEAPPPPSSSSSPEPNPGPTAGTTTVVAFAQWNFQPAATHQPPPPDSIWPRDGDVALSIDFFSELSRQHDAIMGDRAHWYLELVCTRPGWQGKGAGGMLVAWGCGRADADGLECYLNATPDGKPVYERRGFREVKTLPFLGGEYEQCFMVRDARPLRTVE